MPGGVSRSRGLYRRCRAADSQLTSASDLRYPWNVSWNPWFRFSKYCCSLRVSCHCGCVQRDGKLLT